MADPDDLDEENPENMIDPLDAILAQEPAVLPPGGFMPQIGMGMPPPIPRMTIENTMCLRDCKYYLEQVLHADLGNVEGTDGLARRQKARYCMRMPGTAIDLMDEGAVYECSEWTPYTDAEIDDREDARAQYALRAKEKTNGK